MNEKKNVRKLMESTVSIKWMHPLSLSAQNGLSKISQNFKKKFNWNKEKWIFFNNKTDIDIESLSPNQMKII